MAGPTLLDGPLILRGDLQVQGRITAAGGVGDVGQLDLANTWPLPQTGPFYDYGGTAYNVCAPEFGGADRTGVADSTDAFQAAIVKATTDSAPLDVPFGLYKISDTLWFESITGIGFRGGGAGRSLGHGATLLWDGAATDVPMLRLREVGNCVFEDFTLRADPAKPAHSGVWIESISGGSVTAQRTIWRNVFVNGVTTGIGRGWVTREGVGLSDANNDFHHWIDCETSNYAVGGWLFNHSQSKANVLDNCAATPSDADTPYCVAAGTDWDPDTGLPIAVGDGGSFRVAGGGFAGGHQGTFFLSVTGDVVTISDVNVERCTRALVTALTAQAAASPTVTVRGSRFAHIGGYLHADGFTVIQNSRGNVTFDTCRFESDALQSPQFKQAATDGGLGSFATLHVRNTYVESASTTLIGSQSAVSRASVEDCQWRNRDAGTYGNYANGTFGAGIIERWGTGTPEGTLAAPIGSVFHRSDGGAGTSLYVKETGSGTTGWVGK